MQNFIYDIGTQVFFGEGQLKRLPPVIREHTDKVLLVYGGRSIKRFGIYDQLTALLDEQGIIYYELPGVQPNPRVTTVNEGAALCRQHGIGAVLAVGGGSCIDCAKVIAAAAFYQGDAWDLVTKKAPIGKVLPVFSVLTLAATGSEMNAGAVISNMDTHDKLAVSHPGMRPKASVLDPTFSYTVNSDYTAAGVADIMSHIIENYFSHDRDCFLQDRMAEGMLKTCIEYAKTAMVDPKDYTARANLMWTSSLAINGLISLGKPTPWSVHSMEHQLSAYYDLTHGVGLAILTPAWMRFAVRAKTLDKFADYGVNVWGLDRDLPEQEIAELAIERTSDFLSWELDLPRTLRDVNIGEEHLEEMARKAATPALENAFVPLTYEDILSIYYECL